MLACSLYLLVLVGDEPDRARGRRLAVRAPRHEARAALLVKRPAALRHLRQRGALDSRS